MKIQQKNKLRTFLAVDLPEDLKLSLSKQVQQLKVIPYAKTQTKIKITSYLNYHLTLAFLGNVSHEEIELLKEKLSSIKLNKSINCKIVGLGAFPNIKAARLIFLRIESKELEVLAKNVRKIVKSFGFRIDYDFKPHITIIRFKEKIELLDLEELTAFFNASSFYLMQSILTSTGPLYSKLEKFDIQ